MKKEKNYKVLFAGIAMVLLFVLWTVAIGTIDVQTIGPKGSSVGFATLNGFIHKLTGVHMALYTVTDWLGLIPLCFILGFALLGFIQLIKRKSLFKVDSSILVLGAFYIVVMAAYLFFEFYVVNYRPVLINGYLEASYPSSTTMLVMCVMPTAVMQLKSRIGNRNIRKAVSSAIIAFTAFMVIGRLLSGVHWITDIIGGAIISMGLVVIDYAVTKIIEAQAEMSSHKKQ
ncbi:MAG: phosphatase PAP2 family protein [Acutalibacteraceae bacterium]